jgi:hypothetical protein
MIVIPQPPRIFGTSEEKVTQLHRYTAQLAESLSVWLNVEGATSDTSSQASTSVVVAEVSSDSNVAYGTFQMTYGTESDTTVSVSFGSKAKFADKPVVICSQPFSDRNITIKSDNVSKTGFTASLPKADEAGSCTVMYIAVGKAQD